MLLIFKRFIGNGDKFKISRYGALCKRVKIVLSEYFYANLSSNRVQKKMIYVSEKMLASKDFYSFPCPGCCCLLD